MIKLRALIWVAHPGLSVWATLCNSCSYNRKAEGDLTQIGAQFWFDPCEIADLWHPEVRECVSAVQTTQFVALCYGRLSQETALPTLLTSVACCILCVGGWWGAGGGSQGTSSIREVVVVTNQVA